MSSSWQHIAWRLLGYTPNAAQVPIIRAFLEGTRFVLICGGERAGKSFTSVAMALLRMGPEQDDDGNYVKRTYWIVGPDYAQPRAEFQYIFDALLRGELVDKYSMPETKTQPWTLTTTYGVTVETRTSNDITKLASFTVHGALMIEAAQQSYEVWLKLRGRVSQTRGWVILSGTLERGLQWYATLLRKWKGDNADEGKSFSLPTWSNLAVYPGGRDDPEIKSIERTFPYDLFMERYGAEAHVQHGLVIPEFSHQLHVRHLQLARDDDGQLIGPVNLAVDPASHTYAVLFIQRVGPYAHVLDAVYEHGMVAQDVIRKCMQSPYWEYVDRRNGNAIDIAGTQHHANKSQTEIWQDLAKVSFASKFIPEMTTIQTVRFRLGSNNSFGEPLVYFSSALPDPDPLPDGTAAHFLSEFGLWRWPDRNPNQNVPPKPVDRANDGIKALGYWLVHTYGPVEVRKQKAKIQALPLWGMR